MQPFSGLALLRQGLSGQRGWTPQWELHLRRLTERAKQRLPLFDNDPPGVPP